MSKVINASHLFEQRMNRSEDSTNQILNSVLEIIDKNIPSYFDFFNLLFAALNRILTPISNLDDQFNLLKEKFSSIDLNNDIEAQILELAIIILQILRNNYATHDPQQAFNFISFSFKLPNDSVIFYSEYDQKYSFYGYLLKLFIIKNYALLAKILLIYTTSVFSFLEEDPNYKEKNTLEKIENFKQILYSYLTRISLRVVK